MSKIYIMGSDNWIDSNSGEKIVKIGYTNDIKQRIRGLSTGNPFLIHCYATYAVNSQNMDVILHRLIDNLSPSKRVNSCKEFYRISPREAYDILKDISIISGTEDMLEWNPLNDDYIPNMDNDVEEESNIKEPVYIPKKKHSLYRRDDTTFAMLGIPKGSKLEFYRDSRFTCIVSDDVCNVFFNNVEISLNKLSKVLLNKLFGLKVGSGTSWKEFTYNGEICDDIRTRLGLD